MFFLLLTILHVCNSTESKVAKAKDSKGVTSNSDEAKDSSETNEKEVDNDSKKPKKEDKIALKGLPKKGGKQFALVQNLRKENEIKKFFIVKNNDLKDQNSQETVKEYDLSKKSKYINVKDGGSYEIYLQEIKDIEAKYFSIGAEYDDDEVGYTQPFGRKKDSDEFEMNSKDLKKKDSGDGKGWNTKLIVGVVIGIVVLIVVAVIILRCISG